MLRCALYCIYKRKYRMFGRKFQLNNIIFCVLLFKTFSSIDGKKIQERIIGGEDSHISEVPWQVQLTITKKNIGFICGGSWISPGRNDGMMDFVLTAAHCIDGVKDKPHFLSIRAGGDNLASGNVFEVVAITLHPRYENASGGYDIALINLARPVKIMPSRAEPVKLADGPAPDKRACRISGFGYLYPGAGPSWTLQKVDLPIIDTQECWLKWRKHSVIKRGTGFCSYTNDSNSCSGDSGGPLVCFHHQDGLFYQHGVASFMTPRCTHGFFTNVSMFKKWITRTANKMRSRRREQWSWFQQNQMWNQQQQWYQQLQRHQRQSQWHQHQPQWHQKQPQWHQKQWHHHQQQRRQWRRSLLSV